MRQLEPLPAKRFLFERLHRQDTLDPLDRIAANIERVVGSRSGIDGLDTDIPVPVGSELYSNERIETICNAIERAIKLWEPRLENVVVSHINELGRIDRATLEITGQIATFDDDEYDFPVRVEYRRSFNLDEVEERT